MVPAMCHYRVRPGQAAAPVISVLLVFFVGCGSTEPSPAQPTTLQCPTPGALPFQLESHGFQNSDNATVVRDNPRNKDEASATLGNPSGLNASIYDPNTAVPTTALAHFHGRKARAPSAGGVSATPLAGEYISLWQHDAPQGTWTSVGRTKTDASGYYEVTASVTAMSTAPVYAVLEADGSCTEHEGLMLPPGSNVIVTDIDGTLTSEDAELYKQLDDLDYLAAMKGNADTLIQRWSAKKYPVVYLTARPHLFRADSISWLSTLHFPEGAVITSNTLLISEEPTVSYKTAWMRRMTDDFGWKVVAAYGNALTDIDAYQAVHLSNERILIIGPNAGAMGTTAVLNDDYEAHIAGFVNAQPDNAQ
jgi:hypothetical protein